MEGGPAISNKGKGIEHLTLLVYKNSPPQGLGIIACIISGPGFKEGDLQGGSLLENFTFMVIR